MGLLDSLRTAPPPRGRVTTTPDDYDTHGSQPGPHQSGMLAESQAHLDAIDRGQRAKETALTEPVQVTPIPIVKAKVAAPDEWTPETFILSPGVVVQILGRDDQRETADVTNQTNLENTSGTGQAVYLFRNEGDARNFVNTDPVPNQGRFAILPDGAGREMKHTASVWAVIPANAAHDAVIDVTAERYKGGRP